MDQMSNKKTVTMWAAQTEVVLETLENFGVSYVKKEYIKKKYGEVAWIFETAYDFFIRKFRMMVEKPVEAESPIWLYTDPKWAGANQGTVYIKLEIPEDAIVFFDRKKWSKILNLSYIGSVEEQEKFEQKMKQQGVKEVSDLFAKPYYPMLKNEVTKTWSTLFDVEGLKTEELQGAVWVLKKEWVKEVIR